MGVSPVHPLQNLTPAQATVIAAFFSGVVAIVVCILNNRQQQRKLIEELRRQAEDKQKAEAVRDAMLETRLKNVEQKLDIHNGYADKIGSIEQNLAYIRGKLEMGG